MSATDQLEETTMTDAPAAKRGRGGAAKGAAQPDPSPEASVAAVPDPGHLAGCPGERVEVSTATGPQKNSEGVVIGTAHYEVSRCIDCGSQSVNRTD